MSKTSPKEKTLKEVWAEEYCANIEYASTDHKDGFLAGIEALRVATLNELGPKQVGHGGEVLMPSDLVERYSVIDLVQSLGNEKMQVRIKAAAIMRFSDGEVFSVPQPLRHSDIISDIYSTFGSCRHEDYEQGFITDSDVFVTRTEAWRIAEAAGQLLPEEARDVATKGTLYTEDLW